MKREEAKIISLFWYSVRCLESASVYFVVLHTFHFSVSAAFSLCCFMFWLEISRFTQKDITHKEITSYWVSFWEYEQFQASLFTSYWPSAMATSDHHDVAMVVLALLCQLYGLPGLLSWQLCKCCGADVNTEWLSWHYYGNYILTLFRLICCTSVDCVTLNSY